MSEIGGFGPLSYLWYNGTCGQPNPKKEDLTVNLITFSDLDTKEIFDYRGNAYRKLIDDMEEQRKKGFNAMDLLTAKKVTIDVEAEVLPWT